MTIKQFHVMHAQPSRPGPRSDCALPLTYYEDYGDIPPEGMDLDD